MHTYFTNQRVNVNTQIFLNWAKLWRHVKKKYTHNFSLVQKMRIAQTTGFEPKLTKRIWYVIRSYNCYAMTNIIKGLSKLFNCRSNRLPVASLITNITFDAESESEKKYYHTYLHTEKMREKRSFSKIVYLLSMICKCISCVEPTAFISASLSTIKGCKLFGTTLLSLKFTFVKYLVAVSDRFSL